MAATSCATIAATSLATRSLATSTTFRTAAKPIAGERLSGEGTGRGLGVSNPRLTWILVGVTAVVWVVFFTYSSKLPAGDDDSGLSL